MKSDLVENLLYNSFGICLRFLVPMSVGSCSYEKSIVILFVLSISSIAYFSYKYHNYESYKKILEINNSLNRENISGKLYYLAFKIIRKASDELNINRVYKKIKYQNQSKNINLQILSKRI